MPKTNYGSNKNNIRPRETDFKNRKVGKNPQMGH